jgi:flagellar motor switch protein FliN
MTTDTLTNEPGSMTGRAPQISRLELEDMTPAAGAKSAKGESNFGRVLDVSVSLTARIATVRKTISDIIDLAPGSVIDLEREAGEPIEVVIGDKLIARGEIVVVDDRYGVRITEVVQDG